MAYRIEMTKINCAWCDTPVRMVRMPSGDGPSYSAFAWPFICEKCLEPIKPVLSRLLRHKVSHEYAKRLLHNSSCDICGMNMLDPTRRKRPTLVVDHDHECCSGSYSCGKCVRGFLCASCNMALGQVGDRLETLRLFTAYLERHEQIAVVVSLFHAPAPWHSFSAPAPYDLDDCA